MYRSDVLIFKQQLNPNQTWHTWIYECEEISYLEVLLASMDLRLSEQLDAVIAGLQAPPGGLYRMSRQMNPLE